MTRFLLNKCRAASYGDGSNALGKQRARLRGLASYLNMTIVGEVYEYGSGTAKQRTGWNKVLQIAEVKSATAIFVTDYSRIARNWDAMIDAVLDAFDRGLEFIAADEEQPFYLFINTYRWIQSWGSVENTSPCSGMQNSVQASTPVSNSLKIKGHIS